VVLDQGRDDFDFQDSKFSDLNEEDRKQRLKDQLFIEVNEDSQDIFSAFEAYNLNAKLSEAEMNSLKQ
jgi:hypothetical protein